MKKEIRHYQAILVKGVLTFILIYLSFFNQSDARNKYVAITPTPIPYTLPDVTVGQRTGDSTGTLSISRIDIQQSILSTVSFFNGYAISDDAVSLSVSSKICYLIFNLVKSSSASLHLAVELTQTTNNLLIFQPHSYSQIFFYSISGNDTNEKFLTDWNKSITGCISNTVTGLSAPSSTCKFSIIKCQ